MKCVQCQAPCVSWESLCPKCSNEVLGIAINSAAKDIAEQLRPGALVDLWSKEVEATTKRIHRAYAGFEMPSDEDRLDEHTHSNARLRTLGELRDELMVIREENRDLKVENSELRRKVERLERKR